MSNDLRWWTRGDSHHGGDRDRGVEAECEGITCAGGEEETEALIYGGASEIEASKPRRHHVRQAVAEKRRRRSSMAAHLEIEASGPR